MGKVRMRRFIVYTSARTFRKKVPAAQIRWLPGGYFRMNFRTRVYPRREPCSVRSLQKRSPAPCFQDAGRLPGDDLLSQDLSSHYHRRWGVSLPGSEWDRGVPPRSGHQRAALVEKGRDSGGLKRRFVVLICRVPASGFSRLAASRP